MRKASPTVLSSTTAELFPKRGYQAPGRSQGVNHRYCPIPS
ncbi:uncharacterized protein G2W53_037603 [Senna tora]|uniref:Uncharacterized protein n=1 Tax=Senna tora TaxID=362788 RepID=A0A834SQM4_9FABA|nr:uncharacterized protein G2W53_037603 [Senna tora]